MEYEFSHGWVFPIDKYNFVSSSFVPHTLLYNYSILLQDLESIIQG